MKAVLYDPHRAVFLRYEGLRSVVSTDRLDAVMPCLREIEQSVNNHSLHAVGFISYEAAPAFDAALRVHPPSTIPAVCFGLFERTEVLDPPSDFAAVPLPDWRPHTTVDEYRNAIGAIKEHIAAGDTYQVNYTIRMRADFTGDSWSLFLGLHRAQPQANYNCYIETDGLAVCSVSPELFFELEGTAIHSRPMKGTAPRGLTLDDDREMGRMLRNSEKNRAENIMIVDMIRNDIGRIARTGSVAASPLFTVERYDTVWQMTSTVTAQTNAPIAEIIAALFPCASITGAPKAKTMEIIRDLEAGPRGIYTGAIGVISPQRRTRFSVAIRTAVVDKMAGTAEYGAGGGIVWDSDADDEYQEALIKSKVLASPRPDFGLLETLLWEPGTGFFLLNEHLRRMAGSADYFGFLFSETDVREQLLSRSREFPSEPHRVRAVLNTAGAVTIQAVSISLGPRPGPLRLAFSPSPVDRQDRFLYHKTTARGTYENAASARTGYDDVILWNRSREITETTIGNLVFRIGDRLVTPQVRCGLLAGVFRGALLSRGEIAESVITIDAAQSADAVFRINSVRKWEDAVIAAP